MNFDEISRVIFSKRSRDFNFQEKVIHGLMSFIVLIIIFFVYKYQILVSAHWDVGWLKYVTWRNPLQQMPIDCCALDGENSQYISWSWHFSPLFSVFSLLSYIWPFGQYFWFILFLSLPYGMISYFVSYFAFIGSKRLSSISAIFLVSSFSIVVGMSFGIFRSIQFPHYEVYFTAFLLAFMFFLSKNRNLLALTALFLCISVKEDSSFYLAILYVAFFWSKNNSMRVIRNTLVLISPSVVYLIALNVITFDDPPNPNFTGQSNLQSQYLGKTPLDHLDLRFILDRFYLNLNDNWLLYSVMLLVLITVYSHSPSVFYRSLIAIFPHIAVALVGISSVKGGWALYHQVPIWTTILVLIIYLHLNFKPISLHNFGILLVSLCFASFASQSTLYVVSGLRSEFDTALISRNSPSIIQSARENGDFLDENFFVYDPERVPVYSWLREYTDFRRGDCLVSLSHSRTITILAKITSIDSPEITQLKTPFIRTCFR